MSNQPGSYQPEHSEKYLDGTSLTQRLLIAALNKQAEFVRLYFFVELFVRKKDTDFLYVWVAIAVFRKHSQSQQTLWDIFIDTYLAALRFVEDGGHIRSHPSWFMERAKLNLSGKHGDHLEVTLLPRPETDGYDTIEALQGNVYVEKNRVEALYEQACEALLSLSEADQKTLVLTVIEGKSATEIHNDLINKGEEPPSEEALRQRKHRALERLVVAYKGLSAVAPKTKT